jgi:3-dehydroquinate dehydratase-1
MAQLVSSKNLTSSSQPLVVGIVPNADTLQTVLTLTPQQLAQQCDLLEIRLDQIQLPHPQLRPQLSSLTQPLLFTARHPAEGGSAPESAAERMAMLEPYLDIASLIDIELRSLPEMRPLIQHAHSISLPIMGSFHDFDHTPSSAVLEGAIELAETSSLAIAKIATFLNSPGDLARLIQLFEPPHRTRLSLMGMGHLGPVSRLALAKCGSLLNYGYLGQTANAPGQWPAAKLKSLLNDL